MKSQFPRINRCLSRHGGDGESAYRVYGLTREGAHSFSPGASLRSNNPQRVMSMATPPHRLGADRSKLTLSDAPAWLTLRSQDHISIPIGLAEYSECWYQRNCFLITP